MKRVMVILLTIFTANSSMADMSTFPTYEQAQKLVAAAWKSPPRSIDVTYYSTIKDNIASKQQIRQNLIEAINKKRGPDEKLNPENLEREEKEIQSIADRLFLELLEGGRMIKYRVRYDEKSYRVDRVYGRPDRTIRKGTTLEKFIPGKKLDANTPFEMTYIETLTAANSAECNRLFHENKIAEIGKKDRSLTKNKIREIVILPGTSTLQMKLGVRKNDLTTESYDVDETKIKQLCSGTLENVSVKIMPDENEPDAKDRIEISLYNEEKNEVMTSHMICAKDDYSKVYYYQTPNPAFSKPPIFTRMCSDFDAHGFPHHVTEVRYDGRGKIELHEIYRIENIRVNISIPKEVFEFDPPEDYVVTDYRLTPAERNPAEFENMKKLLKNEDKTRILMAMLRLNEYLNYNPSELGEIASSMLDDEFHNVRMVAFHMLTQLLKDSPEELKHIAIIMKDDDNSQIQSMATRVLQRIDSDK